MSVKCVEYTLNYIQTKTLRYIRERCRRSNFNGNNTANNNNNLNNKHVNKFSKKMEKKHLFWWHLFPFYAYKKMILLLLLLFSLCVCVCFCFLVYIFMWFVRKNADWRLLVFCVRANALRPKCVYVLHLNESLVNSRCDKQLNDKSEQLKRKKRSMR